MRWTTEKQAIAANAMTINKYGGLLGIKDKSALGAVMARAQQTFAYEPYVDVFDLAAEYTYGLAKGHVFLDGNKRTAFLVAYLFITANGYKLKPRHKAAFELMIKLAKGSVRRKKAAAFFRSISSPIVKAAIDEAIDTMGDVTKSIEQ